MGASKGCLYSTDFLCKFLFLISWARKTEPTIFSKFMRRLRVITLFASFETIPSNNMLPETQQQWRKWNHVKGERENNRERRLFGVYVDWERERWKLFHFNLLSQTPFFPLKGQFLLRRISRAKKGETLDSPTTHALIRVLWWQKNWPL